MKRGNVSGEGGGRVRVDVRELVRSAAFRRHCTAIAALAGVVYRDFSGGRCQGAAAQKPGEIDHEPNAGSRAAPGV